MTSSPPGQATPPALRIRQLSKRYARGVVALKAVDLEIEPGSFFAILGPNGAGKSTLINILAQVITKTSGKVTLFGSCIDQHPRESKRLIGFTPQEIALDPYFNVRQLLKNHAGYYGIRNNDPWIDTLLQKLDLAPHADKFTRQLSGGMKRRLTIAKALVHQPKLLILDEPTAGVDVSLRHSLWRFIRELHRSGTTVILTTHYLEEAQELADQVAIIDQGRIIARDRTEKLLERFGARRFEIHLKVDSPPSTAGTVWKKTPMAAPCTAPSPVTTPTPCSPGWIVMPGGSRMSKLNHQAWRRCF